MPNTSPFIAMQELEIHLKGLLRPIDVEMLGDVSRKAVTSLKRVVVDARLDIRDYELSETREEQLKNAKEAKNRIAKMESDILAAGDVFSAVDTAHISAKLEQINSWLG